MTPALQVRGLHKRFTAPVLRGLDLDVAPGSLVALLGPSGCGKTTLLRLVAGFERPDAGVVHVAGRDVTSRHVPPERRGVAVVPQEGALFPHLTVRANAAFGLPRRERAGRRVDEVLDLVGLSGLGERMPRELSGGQQQRVAVARALAPAPALVLLDEPFSALDAGLRVSVRTQVRDALHAAGASAVLVTHDQQEALSVADVVAEVRDGVVVQSAPPEEVYAQPADLGVAVAIGEAVVLPGAARGDAVETALGVLGLRAPRSGAVDVVVRPEQLLLDPAGVPAVVTARAFHGHDALLNLRLQGGAEVVERLGGGDLPAVGAQVGVRCRGPVTAFPAAAG